MQLNRIITLIALMQCCSLTFAQSPSDLPANAGPFNLQANQVATFDNRYEDKRLSPLLFDELQTGSITFDKDKRYTNVSLNYDVMSDNVVARMESLGTLVVVRKEGVADFSIVSKGKVLSFDKRSINDIQTFVLRTALANHFIKISKKIVRTESEGGYAVDKPSESISFNCELYVEYNGVLVKSLLNKRALVKQFPKFKSQIESHIKANKTNFSKYEDVLTLFEAIASWK